jgi:nicotinamidase-related amidase
MRLLPLDDRHKSVSIKNRHLDYKRKVIPLKSAILVIDVQSRFFVSDPKPFEADEVVERINHLTHQARGGGKPVIFIQHEQASDLLTPESEGWQLHSGLVVEDMDYRVRKTTPDAFQRTNLEEILKSSGVEDLIICGYASEFCVDTTTRRAAALGYAVQLVADAHTTDEKAHASAKRIREHHNATLANIRSFGPSILAVKTQDIRFEGSSAL